MPTDRRGRLGIFLILLTLNQLIDPLQLLPFLDAEIVAITSLDCLQKLIAPLSLFYRNRRGLGRVAGRCGRLRWALFRILVLGTTEGGHLCLLHQSCKTHG